MLANVEVEKSRDAILKSKNTKEEVEEGSAISSGRRISYGSGSGFYRRQHKTFGLCDHPVMRAQVHPISQNRCIGLLRPVISIWGGS